MEFAAEHHLLILWGVLPLCIWLAWSFVRWRTRYQRFFRLPGNGQLQKAFAVRPFLVRGFVLVSAFAAIVIALAQPRWGYEMQEVRRSGSDILIVLDLSASMLAQDVSPNRLERARREVIDFLGMVRGDRVGLVAFAGSSFLALPLTSDYQLIRNFLPVLTPDYLPTPGSAIGEAVSKAIQALDNAASEQSRSQTIVILSDGEDHGKAVEQAISQARERGIRVFGLGIGTSEGAPVPSGTGFKRDGQGSLIVSRLGEATMNRFARETGGQYVRAVPGDSDWDAVYLQGIRGGSRTETMEVTLERRWHERFQWFLGLAIALLLLEGWGWQRTLRRATTMALAFGLVSPSFSSSVFAQHRHGEKAYADGDYTGAMQQFLEAETRNPQQLEHTYNRSVAAYRAGRFEEAAQGFSHVAEHADGELAEQARFNLANSQVQLGDLEQAIQTYERALESQPDDRRIQENLDYVKELLAQEPPPSSASDQQNSEEHNNDDQDTESEQEAGESSSSENDQSALPPSNEDQQPEDQQLDDDKEQGGTPESAEEHEPAEQQSASESESNSDLDDSDADEKAAEAAQEQPSPTEGDDGEGAESGDSMSEDEAERMLRGLDDPIDKFHNAPKDSPTTAPAGKDW